VAGATSRKRRVGREADSDEPERSGSRQEQIEKLLERNIRLLLDRKVRQRAIWEDMLRGSGKVVISIALLSCATAGVGAVDVTHEEVSK